MIVKDEKCETSFYTPSARPHSRGDDRSQPETKLKMQFSVGKHVRTLKIIAGCALLGARISMSRSVLTGQVYRLPFHSHSGAPRLEGFACKKFTDINPLRAMKNGEY